MAKNNSELKDIQKKLMAAVAMVLVACIMVVSSSYAWFTLSTAPEVTGITTSVGSNGNLEMALRTIADVSKITSGVGYSFPEANEYWGNLVDLSSETTYHMSSLALAPARLNATIDTANSKYSDASYTVTTDTNTAPYAVGDAYGTDGEKVKTVSETGTAVYGEDGTTVTGYEWTITTDKEVLVKAAYKLANTAYLQTPVYGSDGRVSSLSTDSVINGTYVTAANGFAENTSLPYGVRAIGTSSKMTPEEMALRTAKQTVSSAISTSKSSASTSLRVDSVKLANIIVTAYVEKSATFTKTDVQAIQDAVTSLTAIKDSLMNALNQTVIAIGVAQGTTLTAANITWSNTDITTTTALDWTGLDTMKAALLEGYKTIVTMESSLSSAQTGLSGITKETGITFEELKTPLFALLGTDDFVIIDSATGTRYDVEKLKSMIDTDLMTVAKVLMSTPTVAIVDGIYHDIALFSGNYSANASMEVDVTYGSISTAGQPIDVVMATEATEPTITTGVTGYYLSVILNQLSSVTVKTEDTEGDDSTSSDDGRYTIITDIYGYAVDLAFRTNAANSSLLLQTEAANRVEDSEVTQGGGSYMQFTSSNEEFTLLQVADLMNSIRVVFMNDAGNIYGVAAMKVSYEAVTTTDTDGNTVQVAYAAGTDGHDLEVGGYAYTLTGAKAVVDGDKTYLKAELYLYGFSVDAEGKLTLGDKLASNVLTELDQNTALGVTSVVYLDGDEVENSDVAINGNSMTGTMNLQFASSAELDPMDYTYADQLATPTVSLADDGKTLTIGAVENATSYDIYVGSIKVGSLTAAGEYTLPTTATATVPAGTYDVTVVATASGYTNSRASTPVQITVVEAAADDNG